MYTIDQALSSMGFVKIPRLCARTFQQIVNFNQNVQSYFYIDRGTILNTYVAVLSFSSDLMKFTKANPQPLT